MPLLAVRKVFRQLVFLIFQVKNFKQLFRFLKHPLLFAVELIKAQKRSKHAVMNVVMHGDAHVVQHRQVLEKAYILESPGQALLGYIIRFHPGQLYYGLLPSRAPFTARVSLSGYRSLFLEKDAS